MKGRNRLTENTLEIYEIGALCNIPCGLPFFYRAVVSSHNNKARAPLASVRLSNVITVHVGDSAV